MPLRPRFINEVTVDGLSWKKKQKTWPWFNRIRVRGQLPFCRRLVKAAAQLAAELASHDVLKSSQIATSHRSVEDAVGNRAPLNSLSSAGHPTGRPVWQRGDAAPSRFTWWDDTGGGGICAAARMWRWNSAANEGVYSGRLDDKMVSVMWTRRQCTMG